MSELTFYSIVGLIAAVIYAFAIAQESRQQKRLEIRLSERKKAYFKKLFAKRKNR